MRLSLLIASLFTRSEQRAVVWLTLLLIVLAGVALWVETPGQRERGGDKNLFLTDSLAALYFAQFDSFAKREANRSAYRSPRRVEERIEMNRADTADFSRLPGIGAVLSARIVKYRNLLGGFVEKRQLLEVYGIDSLLYRRCIPYLFVDTLALVKLDVNHDSFGRFLRHPYLEAADVELLFRYRRQQGVVNSLSDIRQHIWGDSLFLIMRPYISVLPLSEPPLPEKEGELK